MRKIHEWVRGTDPVTGKPYEAGDPALLIWVHAALVDSGLAAAARYGLALTPAEQDQYVAEMTAAAELVGVPARRFAEGGAPASVAELDAYFAAVRPSLATSQSTEDIATYLIGMPDVEPELADVWEVLAAAAVASLPGWARAMYGFGAGGTAARDSVPPEREAVRQVLGVLDAVYLGEPGVLEARQRLTLRMRAAQHGRHRASTIVQQGRTSRHSPVNEPKLRVSRGLAAMRLAARGGARYAASAPRLFAAAGERRQQLRDDLALRTAQDVADTLGTMKGVLMKIGQLASYVDEGLAPPARRVLSRLQDSVPPMSPELAAGVIEAELGAAPERIFKEWDPLPIAAASIGQVHRAITTDGQAVAVKVQYPGIAETIAADLGNVGLIRSLLKMAVPSQDVTALIEELRERIGEELDYVREAENQRQFAAYFDGHPTARVPKIVDELSTARVITSELAAGARFGEMLDWPQEEKDLAAETIYRFTFRSLYGLHAFNGDPHPGNYLFEPGGQVTFLDFGLVKHFGPTSSIPSSA